MKIGTAVAILIILISLISFGCSSNQNSSSNIPHGTHVLNVVTSVAPLTDIVRNIGGDRINLTGVIPDGADSHTYEPKPGDAELFANADLIILNGLHLEAPTLSLASAVKKSGTQIIQLGPQTINESDWIFDFSFPKEKGDPNPHLWMNVQYAIKYAEITRDALVETDPANAAYYNQNAEKYVSLLKTLDQGIYTSIQTIPPGNRKLLTYHDSWAYFSRRYGMTVIGAVQPSDFSEPSAYDVARLVDQIRSEKVPAIFASEVYPSKVMEEIARDANVTVVTTLADDVPPGPIGSQEHTYVGMMLKDMNAMIPALGGNSDALRNIRPDDIYTLDNSTVMQ